MIQSLALNGATVLWDKVAFKMNMQGQKRGCYLKENGGEWAQINRNTTATQTLLLLLLSSASTATFTNTNITDTISTTTLSSCTSTSCIIFTCFDISSLYRKYLSIYLLVARSIVRVAVI